MCDERLGDGQVGAPCDPLPVIEAVGERADGRFMAQGEREGEPALQRRHRVHRADRVGEHDRDEVTRVCVVDGRGHEIRQLTPEPGEPAVDRYRDLLDPGQAGLVQFDQQGRLGVGCFRERVGQRRAAVAQAVTQCLRSVEMTECGVGDPGEQFRRDGRHAADSDVALTLAALAAVHPGMGADDAAPPVAGPCGVHGTHRPSHGRRVGRHRPGLRRPGLRRPGRHRPGRHRRGRHRIRGRDIDLRQGRDDRSRFKVGKGIDVDRAVGVLDDDGVGDASHLRADTDPGIEQPRLVTKACGGVMITADHHNLRAGVAYPRERLVEQPHGGDRWDGPVVHVSADDDEIDLLGPDDLDEVVDERGLGR